MATLLREETGGERIAERRPAQRLVATRELAALWAAALVIAGFGTWTLWMAMPGLNWGLWTCALAGGAIAFARRAGKELTPALLLPLALACIIALGTAVTADEAWQGLTVLVTAALLAVAVLFLRGERSDTVGALWILTAPVRAGALGALEVLRRLGEAVGLVRAERSVPALRGILIAMPVVGFFALLLSSADPTFARGLRAISSVFEELDWIPRLMFFSVLGSLAVAGFGVALRPGIEQRTGAPGTPFVRLGVTERTILLGSVAGLFALFLALQVSYLFGNAPSVAGSGVTFAEYARRGFGELSLVATLGTLLILLTDRYALRGEREERVRLVQLVLVAELQLFLVSAFRRVLLYEGAYGFTSARLYAQAYMVVVSICLAMLAWEIWTAIDARRLVRRSAVVATSVFALLTYWNHDAWIARQNISRFAETGRVDVIYLGRDLSANAVPTVLASLDRLSPFEAGRLRSCLHQRYWTNTQSAEPERWFEWNLRRGQARVALERAGIDVTVKPPPTRTGPNELPSCRWIPGP